MAEDELEGYSDAALEKILAERKAKPKPVWPVTTKLYLHSDKESSYDVGRRAGLSKEAANEFKYAGYEIGFDIVINEDGSSYATHVGGIQLEARLKIT